MDVLAEGVAVPDGDRLCAAFCDLVGDVVGDGEAEVEGVCEDRAVREATTVELGLTVAIDDTVLVGDAVEVQVELDIVELVDEAEANAVLLGVPLAPGVKVALALG